MPSDVMNSLVMQLPPPRCADSRLALTLNSAHLVSQPPPTSAHPSQTVRYTSSSVSAFQPSPFDRCQQLVSR